MPHVYYAACVHYGLNNTGLQHMKILRHLTANDQQVKPLDFKRELSMEAYLIENEGVLELDDTFNNVEIIADELALIQGRSSKGTNGRIDLLISYADEYFGIVELKLGTLEEIHLMQLEDYLLCKDQILEKYKNIIESPKWIGIIVGSAIDPDLAQKLSNGYTAQHGIPIAALTIRRFRSSRGDIFVTTDIYFNDTNSAKDYTKYLFQGEEYGKGRLVLAVIKQYVAENSDTTFAHLEKNFPSNAKVQLEFFLPKNRRRN